MLILGISCLYHDSAAAIVSETEIIAAAQEERFTRKKHDHSFPVNAISFCLKAAGVNIYEIDEVVYYDNPLITLDRVVTNICAVKENSRYLIESGFEDVITSRLSIDNLFRKKFGIIGKKDKLLVCEHHVSHAASAFYPSPFQSAAILTIDGVGEWATTTIGKGRGEKIEVLQEIDYPHSLGLMYSAFTAFCGFKVNSGDYKFMGLAPYGEPIYYDLIKQNIIDIKDDGSYRLNLEYFDFYKNQHMTNEKFSELFGGPPRQSESKITRREMNIAASVQKITEELVIALANHAFEVTHEKNLVMAGGVALNCVANGKLLKTGIFKNIWIQPAAGDAGGALGCALFALYDKYGVKRLVKESDSQRGSYLGPEFDNRYIEKYLSENNYVYEYKDKQALYQIVAQEILNNKVVGWFQGKMEYGPRALGNRSILGNSKSEKMQSILNLKIKYRESFRPFAPSVLEKDVGKYFDLDRKSPYMLLVADVKKSRQKSFDKEEFLRIYEDDMLPIVNVPRSDIPAVTHIDYSARIQTVSEETNYDYYHLLQAVHELSGDSLVINTSFNVRGEPIVCSPEDAYRCFMRTEMDVLVMENYILYKNSQPVFEDMIDWRDEYELD